LLTRRSGFLSRPVCQVGTVSMRLTCTMNNCGILSFMAFEANPSSSTETISDELEFV
jgi:hypothetical protein